VRWRSLQATLGRWLAEALSNGEFRLAERLVKIAIAISSNEATLPSHLCELLDAVDQGESESRPGKRVSLPQIESAAKDFEEILKAIDGGIDAFEPLTTYDFSVSACSSHTANEGKDSPTTLQTIRNSRTSSRRSPDSYLLTKDWGLPRRCATSTWLSPADRRASRSACRNRTLSSGDAP
jgi:hypothetical protein